MFNGCIWKLQQESILDLSKYQNKQVLVQFQGGRQVIGILKGWDQLQNLVLDETKELIREIDDPAQLTGKTRDLGLVVTRSTALTQISPHEGFEEIENPFASE